MKISQTSFMSMTAINYIKTSLIISSLFFSVKGFSQDTEPLDTLITDRPDATESPNVVPKGLLQVETGAFYESFEDNSVKYETYTFNTALVRYGLLDNLELRLGWDFVESKTKINGSVIDDVSSGFNPLLFGFKTSIANENGCFPEIGFLGHLYLPFTASKDYKPETTGVDFRFAFAHTLSDNSNLSYNLGAAWGDDSSEVAYVYSIAYGKGITEKLGVYAELYGDMPENSKANHFWDAGFTYLISNNVQIDATVGSSITKGQDILISTGISFRLSRNKNKS